MHRSSLEPKLRYFFDFSEFLNIDPNLLGLLIIVFWSLAEQYFEKKNKAQILVSFPNCLQLFFFCLIKILTYISHLANTVHLSSACKCKISEFLMFSEQGQRMPALLQSYTSLLIGWCYIYMLLAFMKYFH